MTAPNGMVAWCAACASFLDSQEIETAVLDGIDLPVRVHSIHVRTLKLQVRSPHLTAHRTPPACLLGLAPHLPCRCLLHRASYGRHVACACVDGTRAACADADVRCRRAVCA